MTDKYIEKQLNQYNQYDSQEIKDDALYRLGTYLEVIEVDSAKLTPEQRQTVINAVEEVKKND